MNTIDLQTYLNENIPISLALGVKVFKATNTQVILEAPLNLNINHKNTVFGGSLHSIATLACWSLVFLNLRSLNISAEIVISESRIKYLAPVNTDFKAECTLHNQDLLIRFEKMLNKKNKARIHLDSQIYQTGVLAVAYHGDFVALIS